MLPENDSDLILARRIGSYLKGQSSFDEEEDPFLKTLLGYKEKRSEQSDTDKKFNSQSAWQNISDAIDVQEDSSKVSSIGKAKISSKTIWAVAASLLIAAFIGIYYYSIQQPQLIASSSESIQTVYLDDGSEVTLRPNSSIYALSRNSQQHEYKLEGEAYFKVATRSENKFSVRAGNGKVIVLGTEFNLSTWGEQTQVYLEEGSINFENVRTNSKVTLNPGQAAEISADNEIRTRTTDIKEFTDWMNRELIFENKTASYVFSEMEQEFNFKISAPDSILNTKLSGTLSLRNADQSLNDLSLVLDGQFIKEAENRYKFVPNR